jgi:hypothetical protein
MDPICISSFLDRNFRESGFYPVELVTGARRGKTMSLHFMDNTAFDTGNKTAKEHAQ